MSTYFGDIPYHSFWDDFFRKPGFNSYYPEHLTPWILDKRFTEITVIYATLLFVLLIMIPAWPMNMKTLRLYVGLLGSLFISWALLGGGIFGPTWAESKIHTVTEYRNYVSGSQIEADIGLYINLHGFNVTIEGTPRQQLNETISYNEGFKWTWAQGIIGFSKYAGHIQRQFREAQHRGAPFPAIRIAEYFTVDGEWIRWGRNYRFGAYYCYLGLRAAWVFWHLVVVIYFCGAPAVASSMSTFAGLLITVSLVVFAGQISIANKNPLEIPFPGGVISPRLSWCFYLNCVVAFILFFVGYVLKPKGLFSRWIDLWNEDHILDLTEDEKQAIKQSKAQAQGHHVGLADGSLAKNLGLVIRKTIRNTVGGGGFRRGTGRARRMGSKMRPIPMQQTPIMEEDEHPFLQPDEPPRYQ